jgi:hypothetical protein
VAQNLLASGKSLIYWGLQHHFQSQANVFNVKESTALSLQACRWHCVPHKRIHSHKPLISLNKNLYKKVAPQQNSGFMRLAGVLRQGSSQSYPQN